MKKVLIGCGVIIVLLVVILGGAAFWGIRAAKRLGNEFQTAQAELEAVKQAFPFKAPADGKLTESQLTDWLKVRGQVQQADKQRVERMRQGGLKAMSEVMTLMPETMKRCATILREAKMSPDEFGWISGQVMGALKSRVAQKDPATAELATLIDQPDPSFKNTGDNKQSGFKMQDNNQRPQYAPLVAEEAQPVLELIKKHQDDFRKVAYFSFTDFFMANQGHQAHPGHQTDANTTATAERNPAAPR